VGAVAVVLLPGHRVEVRVVVALSQAGLRARELLGRGSRGGREPALPAEVVVLARPVVLTGRSMAVTVWLHPLQVLR